jgi:hypothetical protein
MNKEKNLIVAGAAGAAVVIGGIMLLLKSRERKNIHVQALKDLKKELYPLLKEIHTVSNEESTPSGDQNPYRAQYQPKIDAIWAKVLKKHELEVETFKKACEVDYKNHHCIKERYQKLIDSIDQAFRKISPPLPCKIPHNLTPKAALELKKAIQKDILKNLSKKVAEVVKSGKKPSLNNSTFANAYHGIIWSETIKKEHFIKKDLDELEEAPEQVLDYSIQEYSKDESFLEMHEALEEQIQRALQALLMNDRDANIFVEAVGSHLNALNTSVRSAA